MRAAMKPLPTLMKPLASLDLATGEPAQALVERSDVAAVEALAVVAEAAVAWELALAAHEKFGGDSVEDFVAAWHAYLARIDWEVPLSANALGRHLVLIGFMGAGKTRLGRESAGRLGRRFVDVDSLDRAACRQVDRGDLRRRRGGALPGARGAGGRRGALGPPAGGRSRSAAAPSAARRRARCSARTASSGCRSTPETAWARVRRSRRPLARDRSAFLTLHAGARAALPQLADATASDATGIVLAAGGVHYAAGALERLGELVPGEAAGRARRRLDGARAATASGHAPRSGERLVAVHELPPGEQAKQVEVAARLWSELTLDRGGTLVALGGGCTTDLAGFVAATYLRGIDWVAVPTTLVGQVDAAIGGKTGIDLPGGKNLVGAFHWPVRVVIDETLLADAARARAPAGARRARQDAPARRRAARPARGRRLQGRALPRGSPRPRPAAAAQPRPHLRPRARGRRRLRAASRGGGRARAARGAAALGATHRRGRAAARPRPVPVDAERAWAALLRDKKRSGAKINVGAARRARPLRHRASGGGGAGRTRGADRSRVTAWPRSSS